MPLQYKENVIDHLKREGFSTYRLRKEGLLSEGCIQSLRSGKPISWANIEALCALLHCQPGDLLEHKKEPEA